MTLFIHNNTIPENMDKFFSDLDIKYPKIILGVKSKKPHAQTAEIMKNVVKYL